VSHRAAQQCVIGSQEDVRRQAFRTGKVQCIKAAEPEFLQFLRAVKVSGRRIPPLETQPGKPLDPGASDRVWVRRDLFGYHIAAQQPPCTRFDESDDRQNRFSLLPDANLALVVERTAQRTHIKVYPSLHRPLFPVPLALTPQTLLL